MELESDCIYFNEMCGNKVDISDFSDESGSLMSNKCDLNEEEEEGMSEDRVCLRLSRHIFQ
jgi:hypothetical protein